MLELVTFTGVDIRTSRQRAVELAEQHPGTEWGFLAGSATGNEPRFPPFTTLAAWRDFAADNGLRTALHLCGRYSREVARGRGREHLSLWAGFGRVQINLAAAERHARIGAIVEFQDALGAPVILQHDRGWDAVPTMHEGIEYLFDRSGGRGLAPERLCEHWPDAPAETRRYGYAGGIRITNAHHAFAFAMRQRNGSSTWLDMETHVRSDDYLDLSKVEKICKLRRRAETGEPNR